MSKFHIHLVAVAIVFSTLSPSACVTTDQLHEWIIANKNALPKSAQEVFDNATESDLAAVILKMLGFGSSKSANTPQTLIVSTPQTTPRSGVRVSERDVCPFNADPLILSGDYSYCKVSNQGDCPFGFICDQSFVLGRSICCQDLRSRPGARVSGSGVDSNVVIQVGVPNTPMATETTRNNPSLSTVTPTASSQQWTLTQSGPIVTRKTPWYIKNHTLWNNAYNRFIPETRIPSNLAKTNGVPIVTVTQTPIPFPSIQVVTTKVTPVSLPTKVAPSVMPFFPTLLPTTVKTTTMSPSSTFITQTVPSITTTPSTFRPSLAVISTTNPKSLNSWAHFWTTTSSGKLNVNITVLQTGSIHKLRNGQSEMVGAITLINDNGMRVLVDTGSSADTERLLQSLSKEGITLNDIEVVVITHGHPGNMGNMNFFHQKPILFHSNEYIGRHVTPTELHERPYRKLSNNIEVWKTPGHTQHDLSVLVHNIQNYGSMAIVGDLIPTEAFIAESIDAMVSEGAWDTTIKRQNANLIICMADWIIPGHGQPFRVLPQYRQKAGCTRLLANATF